MGSPSTPLSSLCYIDPYQLLKSHTKFLKSASSYFQKMEERKWEEMNDDCLVNIFGRVELETRVQAIPLVCKAWHKALLNPSCWEHLIFPAMFPKQTELFKLIVNRSQRRAKILALPFSCDREALLYVSEELPGLKTLVLSPLVCFEHRLIIPSLIIKWKNLEALKLGDLSFVEEILEPIAIHLPKFALLCVRGYQLRFEAAAAIGSHVPKLKALIMNEAMFDKEDLLLIMRGCKKLVRLHVRNCIGFDEDDEDILRLSSGIKDFQCDGSKRMNEQDQMMKRLNIACQSITERDVDNGIFNVTDGVDGFEWDLEED